MAFKLFRGSHDFCPSLFITSTYSGGCEGKILPVLERLPAKLAVRGSYASVLQPQTDQWEDKAIFLQRYVCTAVF